MEKILRLHNEEEVRLLFGRHDENIKYIETELAIKIIARGVAVVIQGSEQSVGLAGKLVMEIVEIIRLGGHLMKEDLNYAVKLLIKDNKAQVRNIYLDRIEVMSKRQFVTPKTRGQKSYVDQIRVNDITFGIGPAGTGKTYLAMAMAVNALKKEQVAR